MARSRSRPAASAPQTMATPSFYGIDQVMGFPTTWALGYSPARLGSAQPRPGSTFGMVGSNGTEAYADIDSGVAVAVAVAVMRKPNRWRLLGSDSDR